MGKIKLLMALAFFAISLTLTAEDDYAIRLHRTSKVGDMVDFSSTGHALSSMELLAGKKVIKQQSMEFDATCAGTYTVMGVNANGSPINYKIKFKSLTRKIKGDDKEEALLEPGAEITLKKTPTGKECLMDGKPLPPKILKVVELFFSLPRSELTDDDVFGTKNRIKMGDSWPIHADKIADDLKSVGIEIAPGHLKGAATLEKVLEVDGEKCLHISCKMDIDNFIFPLPPGFTIVKSSMIGKYQGDFPVDSSKHEQSSSSSTKMSASAIGIPPGTTDTPPMTLSIRNIKEINGKFSPVSKDKP